MCLEEQEDFAFLALDEHLCLEEQPFLEEHLAFPALVPQECLLVSISQADNPEARTTPARANLADFKNLDLLDIINV